MSCFLFLTGMRIFRIAQCSVNSECAETVPFILYAEPALQLRRIRNLAVRNTLPQNVPIVYHRNTRILTQFEIIQTHIYMIDFHVEVPEHCTSDVVVLTVKKRFVVCVCV